MRMIWGVNVRKIIGKEEYNEKKLVIKQKNI